MVSLEDLEDDVEDLDDLDDLRLVFWGSGLLEGDRSVEELELLEGSSKLPLPCWRERLIGRERTLRGTDEGFDGTGD